MSYGYTVEGYTFPDFNLTFALSGDHADMDALVGLAVSQDTASANTVKLAADGDAIFGVILAAEDGKSQGEGITVTVQTKFGGRVKYTGEAPTIGSGVVGGGDGLVKADATSTAVLVWEVDSANSEVLVTKL